MRYILSNICIPALFVLFIFLSTTVSSLPTESNAGINFNSHDIERLEAELDSIVNEISAPGAAVAIVSRDSVVWIGTFGKANISTGEPVTEKTRFCIGSCTKSFTGLCFLKLLDEGRIDLNTSVTEIAPEIDIDNPWADSQPVRIIHLLEHTSGFDDSHPNWFYTEGPILTLRQALEKKAHLRKVRWQPGTRFSYTSVGFDVAGYILEKKGGLSYDDYLMRELLIPIGMRDTRARAGYSQSPENHTAVGYDRNIEPEPVWYDYDVPAGGVYSTIRDMSHFVRFLLNRGRVGDRQIIEADLFDRVGHPVSTLAAKRGLVSGYSFGIGTRFEGGTKWFGHSGAVPGFVAEYYYNPAYGIGFVVLQNSFGIIFSSDVFDHVWDFVKSQADALTPPAAVSVPESILKSYCGYYESRNPRLQIMGFAEILAGGVKVLYEHDTLYTEDFAGLKTPLIPVSDSLFRRLDDPEATRVFTRDSENNMVFASQGTFYVKAPIWNTYLYRFLVFGALIIMLSSLVYALFWIPVHLYKKFKHNDNRSKYLSMRLVPLLAVLSLVLGTVKMGDQTLLEFGLKTPFNVIFYLSTLLFAALSTLSLFTTYRSFYKPVNIAARVYSVLLSSACFGMTVYLTYWGVIGLKLWAY